MMEGGRENLINIKRDAALVNLYDYLGRKKIIRIDLMVIL